MTDEVNPKQVEQNTVDVHEAIRRIENMEKELALLKLSLLHVTKDQEFVSTGLTRFLWLLGGGFVVAFTTWVANGGLKH